MYRCAAFPARSESAESNHWELSAFRVIVFAPETCREELEKSAELWLIWVALGINFGVWEYCGVGDVDMLPHQKRCATLINGVQSVLTQYLQVSQTPQEFLAVR